MDVFEFGSRFNTEEKCRVFLRQQREKKGITCKSCSSTDHFYLANKKQWQCRSCNYRTTLTSGTVMENTKLPIKKWFEAMFWLTCSKKSFSGLELGRKLNISRYETVNNLTKKIRLIMSHYNSGINLGLENEADESFVTTAGSDDLDNKPGRGTSKMMVLIMASYEQKAMTDKNGKETKKSGKALKSVKMECIDDASKKSIKEVWDVYMNPTSKIDTDGFSTYKSLKEYYPGINDEIASGPGCTKHLPWVHTMSSNYKKINLGTFHNTIKPGNLQYYLDEYCFKTNLRNHMKNWLYILVGQGVGFLWNAWL